MPLPQFPSGNITNGRKAKLVYAICRCTGYGRLADGSGWDPLAWAWWNTATEVGDTAHASYVAASAHYDTVLTSVVKTDPLIAIYRAEVRRDRAAAADAVSDDL